MYVAAEVAYCISTISIDGHAHLSIGNAWHDLLQLWLYLGFKPSKCLPAWLFRAVGNTMHGTE